MVRGLRSLLAGRRRAVPLGELGRGFVLLGTVWPGGPAAPFDGAVVVGGDGRVESIGPAARLPELPTLGGTRHWIVPAVVDAHVRLTPGGPGGLLAGGVAAVRDLGAAPALARRWRTGHSRPPPGWPAVSVAGPLLTRPRGVAMFARRGEGDAVAVVSSATARSVVQGLAAAGSDVISLALAPGGPAPSADGGAARGAPGPMVTRAVVQAAHAAGLAVVAHAATVETVRRALDAGVDELAQVPAERLPEALVERIAASGMSVTSCLQAIYPTGNGRVAAANAADLVAAGAVLRYGTGGDGRAGVDPRELDRLADTGLGRLGALRAATAASATAAGVHRRTGVLRAGAAASLVVLPGDPLAEPGVWRAPVAVISDGRLVTPVPD